MKMTLDEWLRLIAGTVTLASLGLGWFVHPAFLLLTVFVGVNLFQSAFSKWCPMMFVLRRAGVRDGGEIPSCCGGA